MFFARLERASRTISFRLALWFFSVFVLGSVMLFGLAYLLLATALAEKDHDSVHMEIRELAALYHVGGLPAVEQQIAQEEHQYVEDSFLVRVTGGPDVSTRVLRGANKWSRYDLARLDAVTAEPRIDWIVVPARAGSTTLEVAALRLADGAVLEVGQPTEDREEILRRFRSMGLGVLIPVLLLAVAGGVGLAGWSLRPIRHIIHTVRAIEAGTLDARVPTRRTGDELDELARLFNQMLERNTTLIAGMRGALDTVAHDLRTPVARIRGVAEAALRADGGSEAFRHALADCVDESDQLLTMLNTLMDISEAETGALRLRLDRVNLTELVEDTIDLYRQVAEERAIAVSAAAGRDLWLTADGSRLRQVLANLLDNALKYTPPGGHVTVSAQQAGHTVVVAIEDSGRGLTPDEMPRIWERLYRGDHSRSERGLGLGLSLVRAIVRAHGGRVDVESALGIGSTFVISFPATAPVARQI